MPDIDKYRFESRGGRGCSNSDYGLRRTTCCGAYGVEDSELHDFYFDPADLTRVVPLYGTHPCPLCGIANWDFADVTGEANAQPWSWAIRPHPPAAKDTP